MAAAPHSSQAPSPQPADSQSPPPRRRSRSYFPRFGLRGLLVFAILFCLPFAWVGRNLYRIRHEDAAIETLKRAGAMILMQEGEGQRRHPAIPQPSYYTGAGMQAAPPQDPYRQALGLERRAGIEHVVLDSRNVDRAKLQAALDALARFPEIENVTLIDRGFDNDSLLALKELPNLRTLSLDGTMVTGEGLRALAPPLQIRTIFVSGGKAADLLPGLTTLTGLESVTLHAVRWNRADLEAIAALPRLKQLRLRYGRAHAADDYQALAGAKQLRVLEIEDAFDERFLEQDAGAISAVPSLETLTLTGIGDAGLARLGPLPSLMSIRLKAPATLPAVRAFSAAHPKCVVRYQDERNLSYCFVADRSVGLGSIDDAATTGR